MTHSIGKRFGRLTLAGIAGHTRYPSGRSILWWVCQCDCGKKIKIRSNNITSGMAKSCGCLRRETSRILSTTHGMTKTKEHGAWQAMIGRCHREDHISYPWYGARGIKVCREWRKSFEAFYNHIGPAPSNKLTVDRIDNEGNYEPGNVRWATRHQQAANKRPRWGARREGT